MDHNAGAGERRLISPARAGIDPMAGACSYTEEWFPRPRGDEAAGRFISGGRDQAAPRARG